MNGCEEDYEQLLQFLEHGQQANFLYYWNTLVPTECRNSEIFRRLTLDIHLYFVVRCLKASSEDDYALEALKNFFNANGADYSSEEDLAYFALPFICEPQQKAIFKQLFSDLWERNFKARLSEYVKMNCHFDSDWRHSSGFPEIRDKTYSNSAHYWEKRYGRLRRQFQNLFEDTKIIMGITDALISALQDSLSSNRVELSTTLLDCSKNCGPVTEEIFSGLPLSLTANTEPVFSANCLNIAKIKTDLLDAGVKTKLLILQALRWMITRTSTPERRAFIWLISEYDILRLHSQNETQFKDMLMVGNSNSPHPTQQTLTRLLNALASDRIGLSYVACPQVVELLVTMLRNSDFIQTDCITTDQMIATLQKISRMHHFGELMVTQGLLNWIIKYLLKSSDCNYSFKHGLLLLISLSRYHLAKKICLDLVDELLTFTNKFLSGIYKSTENCEYLFWKYCAFLKSVISRVDISAQDWESMAVQFTLENLNAMSSCFNRPGLTHDESSFETQIDDDDPIKVSPNGAEFLKLNYHYQSM